MLNKWLLGLHQNIPKRNQESIMTSKTQLETNETQQLLRKTYIGSAITIVMVIAIISLANIVS